MSSLIEWPSIYGSSYFIPAVIVVVLLLALLLLMSSRRRAAAEAARNAAEPFDEAETPAPEAATEGEPAEAAAVPLDREGEMAALMQTPAVEEETAPSPVEAALPLATAPEALPVTAILAVEQADPIPADPLPDLRQAGFGRNVRVTVRTQGPLSGVAGSDPLNAALLDILGGWGDLAPADLKRLELFRPERLAAAVAAIQLPKSTSGEAKARLSQLRQYSADLERRLLAEQAAALGAARTPVAATTVAAAPTADWEAAAAVPSVGAAAGLATVVSLGVARQTTPESPSPIDSLAETEAETATVAAGAAVVDRQSDLDDIASFWAEPRPLWEPENEVSFQELPAPTYHEVEAEPEMGPEVPAEADPNGNGYEAEQERVYPPLTSVDTFFWDDPPADRPADPSADPMSRLSVKIETAEQLLALPPEEQVDMAVFLEPAELAATFRATRDPELKKAVIDTLEHISSPASLNALGNCFEDNDCDIQLYALEAADRLLGLA